MDESESNYYYNSTDEDDDDVEVPLKKWEFRYSRISSVI